MSILAARMYKAANHIDWSLLQPSLYASKLGHAAELLVLCTLLLTMLQVHSAIYSKTKKQWYFYSIPPFPDGIALFMLAVQFPFHMHIMCAISDYVLSSNVQSNKKISSFTRRLGSIVSLCHSFKLFWGSSLLPHWDLEWDRGLTGFEVSYGRLIDLTLPVDSDHLQMQLLG